MLYDEEEFKNIVRNAVSIPGGHIQKPQTEYLNMTRLYTITTMASAPKYGGERTPAVCSSFERAKEIVEKNEGDIWEYSYDLVVVEAVLADFLYSSAYLMERYWWAWIDITGEDGCYKAIEEPSRFEHIVGFGIG